jgi:D-arabinose 1-dehydrogenase-like Zn-dependent alcohol dehydrogenase
MIAARLHEYHQPLKVEELDEPRATGPLDVVVKIGGAGLCRTTCTSRKASGPRSPRSRCPTPPATRTPAGSTRWARR